MHSEEGVTKFNAERRACLNNNNYNGYVKSMNDQK